MLSRHAAGYRIGVELDLAKFFDNVQHDILMARAARKVRWTTRQNNPHPGGNRGQSGIEVIVFLALNCHCVVERPNVGGTGAKTRSGLASVWPQWLYAYLTHL